MNTLENHNTQNCQKAAKRVNNQNHNKKKLLEKIMRDFERAAEFRKSHEDRWKRYYNLYRCKAAPRKDPSSANIFVPEVFSIIETLCPRLLSNFLNAARPIVQVMSREESQMQNAKAAERLLSYQFERMNFPVKLVSFYKQALLYGTSIGKVYWDYRKPRGGGGSPAEYDDPVFEPVDLLDFYIDPEAFSLEDASYCIHRRFLSKAELKQREEKGIYSNVDEVKGENLPAEELQFSRNYRLEDRFQDEERNIEVLEYWQNRRVITIADRSVILRDTPNPFAHGKKPFVHLVFIPVPFEFYGIGVIEPVEGLQMELNTKRNQRLDNVNIILNRMWLLQRGAVDDLRQLQSRPGGIITVNDINGIQPLPAVDVTASSYREEEKIKLDIQNTSGVSDYIRGILTPNRQTATEVRIKSEQSSSRFEFNFKLMAEMGIKETASQMIQLNQQFIDRERTVRILGERGFEFVKVSPEEISGSFDLYPCVDPLRIEELERKEQMLTLYQHLIQNPIIDKKALSCKLLESFDFKNPEEMLESGTQSA